MSDLLGSGLTASAGNGRVSNNGSSRMQQAAPAPTGSPSGRIRGPSDIMRERQQREARKKAEREALEMERVRAEEEQRVAEQDRRRRAEKRDPAAGVAGERQSGGEGYGSSGSAQAPGQRVSDNSQKSSGGNNGNTRPQDTSIQGQGRGGTVLGGGEAVNTASSRARGPSVSQGQPRPVRPSPTAGPVPNQGGQSAAPAASQPVQDPGEGSGPNTTRRTTQSSFPHAFERWETLSAHWEGLTSFWIRRLEENSNEIQRDPISSQLSRQVTDLSAAGANLFHAVVELQRLRASSERKFQRWFFETRAEQERAQEMQALLEATLQEERRGRAEAIADAVSRESEKSNSEKLLAEMRRELQISKEEARRAWEELGRREQEERERTMSLREGHPTLVGGVQVVPMMQGVPSRNASDANRPQTRDNPYGKVGDAGPVGGQNLGSDTEPGYQSGGRSQRTNDPFIENSRTSAAAYSSNRATASSPQQPSTTNSKPTTPQYSQAPAVQPPATSAGFYQQQQGTTLHPTTAGGGDHPGSEGTYSDTEYDIEPTGQFRRDSRGNKVRYSDPASDDDTDELDVSAERERELAHLQQYGHAPVSGVEYIPASSAAGVSTAPYEGGNASGGAVVDYTGQGYGTDPWVSFPRHHHPTRLSDVLEEDERSRTSASQVSRRE